MSKCVQLLGLNGHALDGDVRHERGEAGLALPDGLQREDVPAEAFAEGPQASGGGGLPAGGQGREDLVGLLRVMGAHQHGKRLLRRRGRAAAPAAPRGGPARA